MPRLLLNKKETPRAKREEINLLLKRIVETDVHVRFLPMCRLYRAFSLLGLEVYFLQRTIALLFGLVAFECDGQAKPATDITSLDELTESLCLVDQLIANLSLRETILAGEYL